ncbi:hypothetical protein GE061_011408 [Apolygus lucorum]|uniref:Protein Wnt n=1 Tax=Apolygus lucorum TaxID=248454 RepID=A0A8S9Y030_APOLU|nr:hypothetical protein GE061_011408 [Apolygus lucorum]
MGVRIALDQCKSQFKWDRWNCPESSFATRYDNPATREMAFVSSITSAGIVHAVTRSCSRGAMPLCGCVKDSPPPDLQMQKIDEDNDSVQAEWEWRGCSDDVTMGALVAKTFLSALEGASADVLSTVNLHNSQLGLAMVRDSVNPECKCHGMSGSCTTKTCWRRVESFSKIGDRMKHRYNRALRVQMNSPRISFDTPETSMVFIDESPDYCKMNATTGEASASEGILGLQLPLPMVL